MISIGWWPFSLHGCSYSAIFNKSTFYIVGCMIGKIFFILIIIRFLILYLEKKTEVQVSPVFDWNVKFEKMYHTKILFKLNYLDELNLSNQK